MDVLFANDSLAKLGTEEAGSLPLPVSVIKAARRKLTLLRSATDKRTLEKWKSLRAEKLPGDQNDRWAVILDDKFRMLVKLSEQALPPQVAVTVLAIEDYN